MILREGLARMESYTTEMMDMLYEVDVYMTPSASQLSAGFNPQEALSHISDLFHVRARCYSYTDYRATRPSCSPSGSFWRISPARRRVWGNFPRDGGVSMKWTRVGSRRWTT